VIPDEVILSPLKPVNLITGYKPGLHSIVPAAFLSENFELSYALANLQIDIATLSLTPDNKVIDYGDALPAFTYKVEGYQYDDDFQ
jgi:hypothetical protein